MNFVMPSFPLSGDFSPSLRILVNDVSILLQFINPLFGKFEFFQCFITLSAGMGARNNHFIISLFPDVHALFRLFGFANKLQMATTGSASI
jgi:hypothetical protein